MEWIFENIRLIIVLWMLFIVLGFEIISYFFIQDLNEWKEWKKKYDHNEE